MFFMSSLLISSILSEANLAFTLPGSSTSTFNCSFLLGSALINSLSVNLTDFVEALDALSTIPVHCTVLWFAGLFKLAFESRLYFSIPFINGNWFITTSGLLQSSFSGIREYISLISGLLHSVSTFRDCGTVLGLLDCAFSKDLKCFSKSGVPLREKSTAFLFTPVATTGVQWILELSEFKIS